MAEYKNLVGSGFPPNIQAQLKKREQIVSSESRDSKTIQFLTNRNAWVRLSSGVLILNKKPQETGINSSREANRITPDGDNTLAKNNVLQGGSLSVNNNSATLRKGFNETYTQGATDNLGFRPMPGITNLSIGTGGKWQTIMQADIEFVCYDLDQLETMSKLYMSLGCTVFLEWGHTNYFKSDGTWESNPTPLNFFDESSKEVLRKRVTNKVISTEGNYQAIIGSIYNFDWKAGPDGTYNCKIKIMGAGGMAESLKVNTASNYDFDIYSKKDDESLKYSSLLENALYSLKNFINRVDKPDKKREGDVPLQNLTQVTLNTTTENYKTGKKESYATLLNRIYKLSNYKGPSFTNEDNTISSPNENVVYGNAWSLLAGYESKSNIQPLPKSLYYGYRSAATIDKESSFFSFAPPTSIAYITLGHLMTLIQHLGIFTEGRGDILKPAIYIDYNPSTTIIKRGKIEASIDPGKCLIPYFATSKSQNLFYSPLNLQKPGNDTLWWTGKGNKDANLLLEEPKRKNRVNRTLGESFRGRIFDSLVSIDFAISTLKNISDNNEDKTVTLIEYINSILDGINVSLGKVNSLRTFYDDTSNCIRIIDENYIEEETKTQVLTLSTYGTQSTVYDYGLSSKITSKLASQIVISAQAIDSGGIRDFPEDVLSYQKLNGDVIDKFAKVKKPSIPPQNSSNEQDGEDKTALQKLLFHIFDVYILQDLKSSTINNLVTLYADLQSTTAKKADPKGTVLVPIEYTLTLDGISGILPYNIFRIPDNRLPKRYRGKVDFAVFSINHSIEDNKWYTTLRGQTKIRN